MSAKAHEIGAHSRPGALRKIDKRTRQARRLRTLTDDLTAHVGGRPSVPERLLIDRLAVDIVRLELLDAEMTNGAAFSAHDGRVAHALRNAVRLGLRELGLERRSPPTQSLASILAEAAR